MPAPELVAIVPFRSPGQGKSRLAKARDGDVGLTPAERGTLAAAMLADVVGALAGAGVPRIVVAASGIDAAATAARLGTEAILDPPGARGLNEVVDTVTRRFARARSVLVVAADLPCLTAAEVASLVERRAAVVVAPTVRGGTGALLRRPPSAIPAAYGPGSARRHLERARSAGHRAVTVSTPGFRRDVDTWDDLRHLADAPVGAATTEALRALASRLGPPRP